MKANTGKALTTHGAMADAKVQAHCATKSGGYKHGSMTPNQPIKGTAVAKKR